MPHTHCYERNRMEDILVGLKKKMGKKINTSDSTKNYLPLLMEFLVLKKGQWTRKVGSDSEMEWNRGLLFLPLICGTAKSAPCWHWQIYTDGAF